MTGVRYRLFMTIGAVLMMPSVILLGNCSFNMQALVGAAYLALNVAYWLIGLLPLHYSWDLSRYEVLDVTPEDAKHASMVTDPDDPREGFPSFTRTLWYAIRETKKAGWVARSGSMPATASWERWLAEAADAAMAHRRQWEAVRRMREIMRNIPEDEAEPVFVQA